MVLKKILLIFTFLLSAFVFNLSAEELPQGQSVVKMLKESGYVIYLRHAATNHEQDDVFPVELGDCSKQRNLSSKGIEQSKAIKKSIVENNIKISKIISSPFCRCVDTAKYSAGQPVIDEMLYFAVDIGKTQRDVQSAHLKELLSQVPQKGTNTIIVSHTANLKEATGIWPKPEGVAYVFRPLGDGKYELVGKIEPEEWVAQ